MYNIYFNFHLSNKSYVSLIKPFGNGDLNRALYCLIFKGVR